MGKHTGDSRQELENMETRSIGLQSVRILLIYRQCHVLTANRYVCVCVCFLTNRYGRGAAVI